MGSLLVMAYGKPYLSNAITLEGKCADCVAYFKMGLKSINILYLGGEVAAGGSLGQDIVL